VGVFSATLPPEALEITRKFMNKPVRILVKRDELTLEVRAFSPRRGSSFLPRGVDCAPPVCVGCAPRAARRTRPCLARLFY
jgi:hypothetical protein